MVKLICASLVVLAFGADDVLAQYSSSRFRSSSRYSVVTPSVRVQSVKVVQPIVATPVVREVQVPVTTFENRVREVQVPVTTFETRQIQERVPVTVLETRQIVEQPKAFIQQEKVQEKSRVRQRSVIRSRGYGGC